MCIAVMTPEEQFDAWYCQEWAKHHTFPGDSLTEPIKQHIRQQGQYRSELEVWLAAWAQCARIRTCE